MNIHVNSKPCFRTRSLGELLKTDFGPLDYLLKPLLRTGESMMLWAAPGVGKTMVGLSVALAVGGGGQFLQWQNDAPRKVLLVDGEMNIRDLQDRFRTLIGAIAGIDQTAASENISIFARQDQHPDIEFPDLANKDGQELILKRARDTGAELVILDNFSTLAEVDDENAASAMSPVLNFLMRLKQANIATILVHHSGKSGESYRGSSKLATTFEVIIGLKKATGIAARHPASFELQFDKYRSLRNETIQSTSAWMEIDKHGVMVWQHQPSKDEELANMVDAVKSCDFATQEDLAKHLGWSTGKLSNWKQRAIALKLIVESDWQACMSAARGVAPEYDDYDFAEEADKLPNPDDDYDF